MAIIYIIKALFVPQKFEYKIVILPMLDTFPKAFSQVATSLVCPIVLVHRPLANPSRSARPTLQPASASNVVT